MSDTQSLEGINYNYAFRTWEELTEREQNLCYISDTYKDLNGFRPRMDTSHMTDDEIKAWADELSAEVGRKWDARKKDEAEHAKRTAEALTPKTWTIGELVSL